MFPSMFETDKAKKNLLAFCDLDVVCRLSATNSSWRLCCQDLSFLSRADFSPFFSRITDDVFESTLARWKDPACLTDLNLDYCVALSDKSLQLIRDKLGPSIRRLDLSNLELVTSQGFSDLLNACKELEFLRIQVSEIRLRRLHVDSVVKIILNHESTTQTLKTLDLGNWSPKPQLAEQLLLDRPNLDQSLLLRTFAKVTRNDARGCANYFLQRLMVLEPSEKLDELAERRKSNADHPTDTCERVDTIDIDALETSCRKRPFDVDAVVEISEYHISNARYCVENGRFSEAADSIRRAIRFHLLHLRLGLSPNKPERYLDPVAGQPMLLFPEASLYLPAREMLRDLAKDMIIDGRHSAAYFVHRTLYELTGQTASLWSLLFLALNHQEYHADIPIWRKALRDREDTNEISTTEEFQATINCMLKRTCTATAHGRRRDVAQFWCECPECKMSGTFGICAGCMHKCHLEKGHKAYYLEFVEGGFCDCSCHAPK